MKIKYYQLAKKVKSKAINLKFNPKISIRFYDIANVDDIMYNLDNQLEKNRTLNKEKKKN